MVVLVPADVATAADTTAPQVAITFPTPVALTDAAHVTVTGVSSDDGGVRSVTVNGQTATSADNFANWSANLSLKAGSNTLTVIAEDTAGNSSIATASLKFSPHLFTNPDRLALDSGNNRVLVVDDTRILALDLATGSRSVFADAAVGSGPALQRPRGIAVDTSGGRAIVADAGLRALVAIDLRSGVRRILSGAATGNGPAFGALQGIALDGSGTTAFVVDSSAAIRGIVAVNLQTGARTVLSGTGVAEGPNFSVPLDVALDSIHNRLLVTDPSHADRIMAVDLTSGARSIFSGGTMGSGTPIQAAWRIGIDVKASRALVVDSAANAVVAIDLRDGSRQVFSDNLAVGPGLVEPRGILVDSRGGQVLLAEAGIKTVLTLNSSTGARTRASDDGVGAGPSLGFVEDLALDGATGRIIALQNDPFAVVSVDLSSSDRAAPLDNSRAQGPQIGRAYQIGVDSGADRAIVLAQDTDAMPTRDASIFAVDLLSGARSILFKDFRSLKLYAPAPSSGESPPQKRRARKPKPVTIPDPTDGNVVSNALEVIAGVEGRGSAAGDVSDNARGNTDRGSSGITVNAANWRLLIMDTIARRLMAVDLANGQRRRLASGDPFQNPDGVAYDAHKQRPVVSDSGADAVFGISHGGQWEVLSSKHRGRGPALAALRGLGVDAKTGIVLFYDIGMAALMAVEPSSGDRVIVSR